MSAGGSQSRFSIGGFFGRVRRASSPFETVGDPGTSILNGFVDSQEKAPQLQGLTKYQTYSDLVANTTIVAAGVRYYMNLVSKAGWTVLPSIPNDRRAERAAQLLRDVMTEMRRPWHRAVRRSSGYRLYGFSVQEITARRREDGSIGVLDVAPRPQATIEQWDLEDDGNVRGFVQRSRQDGQANYIPRGKAIYLVDDALNDSPEGLGLFRHLVETNSRLQRYQELEGFAFETDLRGVPIARAPLADLRKQVADDGMSPEEATEALKPIKAFIRKFVRNPRLSMLLDSRTWVSASESQTVSPVYQYGVELLQGGGNGSEPVNTVIERLQRELARVLGVEFLLLGNAGSQALSRDKSHNFGLMVESALDECRETYESDFIPFVMLLNGIPREYWPTFKTETVQYRDVEQITGGLERLSRAGLRADDPAVNEVRELLGVSPQPEDLINLLLEEASGGRDPDPPEPEPGPDPAAGD